MAMGTATNSEFCVYFEQHAQWNNDWPKGCRYSSPTASVSPTSSITMTPLPLLSTTGSLITASPTSLLTSSTTSSDESSLSTSLTAQCAIDFYLAPVSLIVPNLADLEVLNCSGTASCDVSLFAANMTTTNASSTATHNQSTMQSASTIVEFRVINFPILPNASLVHLCMPQRWYLQAPSNSFITTITTFPTNLIGVDSAKTCATVVSDISLEPLALLTTTNISLQARCINGGLLPVPVSILVYWPPAPSTDSPTAVSTATQGITSTGAILGVVGGAASAASSTALLAILTCDDVPPMNTVTYFVSVFFELGLATVALGNVGIVVAVLLLQLVVVLVLRRSRKAKQRRCCWCCFFVCGATPLRVCNVPLPLAEHPRHLGLLLPGSLLGAVGVTLREPTPSNVALGAIAIICIFTAFAGQIAVQRLVALPRASFVLFQPPYSVGTDLEKRFLFPAGRWEPSQVSQARLAHFLRQ
ncbi:Hypothetical protein, putative [Bodo saltans]|uniref:Transmembrane protein n=1 Tax=Bodo saltans TaxID=75058 RepID=A0A0S4IUK9_BODSA|nr:Hypothetical protein, putative [Bodo saltans]|eukprot:CUG11829.1 Hypothetical protein, putative [Bodo saltans]